VILLLACTSTPIRLDDAPLPGPRELQVEEEGEAPLRLSEVVSDNDSVYQQEDGSTPDWVELYNAGTEAIDLSSVSIQSKADSWTGSGSIAPGEYLLVTMELDGAGDRLRLQTPEGFQFLALGALPGDLAWAWYPDGWQLSILPTPGRGNGNAPVPGQDAGELLFQDRWLTRVDLKIPAEGIAALAVDPYQEVPGSVGVGAVWFDDVGVHLKGGWGSLRTLNEKAGFKVDLNEFEDQRIAGQETLTLNSMVQDPTYLHEYLTYTLFRDLGVPAPRTGWAQVYLNGEYYGLYLWVETVDDSFLDRWYDQKDGTLYEGAYGVDLYNGEEYSFEYDEGPDPNDRADLVDLMLLLDADPSEAALGVLEQSVDIDAFLMVMAVEAGTLHWDGYTTQNNYRLYHDPVSGRFSMIPWGTDQTWVDWWYGPYDGRGRLFQWCLAVDSCMQRYNEKLREVADRIESLPLRSMLDRADQWLDPVIQEDPRRESSEDTRTTYRERTRETLEIMPDWLRGELRE
ncbi:MAG TPA: CotH kinase family protein, partial [Myxococcota bacterium]|nr:CotH kinase family protein [Myxococcota bacterium]